MSEPFIAEVKIFAGNFAPRGWAFCNGQLLPIAQNTALFSLVGTTYGGDGRTTFGLPDLQGRAPMHPGNGPGLTNRRLGESGGNGTVALSESQMPTHRHVPQSATSHGEESSPVNHTWAPHEMGESFTERTNAAMKPTVLTATGGGQPHNNIQPYLAINFVIALVGLFPSRS